MRGEVRLYYILYTDPVTSQLFGNEQMRGEVPSVLYTKLVNTDRVTSPLFGNEQMRSEVPSVLYTIYKPSYLAVVRK